MMTKAARKQAARPSDDAVLTRILIVEDEPDIGELIRFHTEREGFAAEVIASGRVALDAVSGSPPDLVVLDLMLPDLDGLEICRRMRWNEATRRVPILIVSAKGDESDVVAGLELGADDYVTKPFSPRVLMARIRNLLRRSQESGSTSGDENVLSAGDGALAIDLNRHEITVNGRLVDLTRTEFDILCFLLNRPGFVRTRDQIISAVHGEKAVLTNRTIDVHVTAIRRKLGPLGAIIQTVRGVGYRVNDSLTDAEPQDE